MENLEETLQRGFFGGCAVQRARTERRKPCIEKDSCPAKGEAIRTPYPPTQLTLLPAFLVVLACASTALGQETIVSGLVVGVHDGDSVTVLLQFQTQLKA